MNINNIVKIDEVDDNTLKKVDEIKNSNKEDLGFIAFLMGDKYKEIVEETLNDAAKAKTIIYLNGAWTTQNSSTTVYTNETYEEIYKKIGEALI